jgi:hypothetical protein
MRVLNWIIGGSVGAVVGILLWTAVVYFTGYEVGLAAAFVGIFVGVGIAAGAGPDRGKGAALFAGAFALLAVVGGKASTAWVYSQRYLAEDSFAATDITDEYLVSCLADSIVEEYEWEGWDLDYPADADLEFPDSQEDYPAEVWAEAEGQWSAMTGVEQQDYREYIESGTEMAPLAAFLFAFLLSFGPFDLIWVGIAISSAYKIVRDVPEQAGGQTGTVTHVETETPAMYLPGLPPPSGVAPTLYRAQDGPSAAGHGASDADGLTRRKAG